jgi:glycosyltransferase involved in cell wall biosynthesis
VRVLGHRNDVPELMAQSDVLLLPSLEEGFPLACMEAVSSGCVPVVSDACGGRKVDRKALVHAVGDVEAPERDNTLLHKDRNLLSHMRAACLRVAPTLTRARAGERVLEVYERVAARATTEERPWGRR